VQRADRRAKRSPTKGRPAPRRPAQPSDATVGLRTRSDRDARRAAPTASEAHEPTPARGPRWSHRER